MRRLFDEGLIASLAEPLQYSPVQAAVSSMSWKQAVLLVLFFIMITIIDELPFGQWVRWLR